MRKPYAVLTAILSLIITLPLCGAVFNIKDFGAVGDGKADDTEAIRKAVAKLAESAGGELYFPLGDYRCAAKGTVIYIKEKSNIAIRFEPGAQLLVDNLQEDGKGNGHGIHIAGPASNITLENVIVNWINRPKSRSHGDGIRFDGFPKNDKTIDKIRMINCTVINAPQAGAIFHGCSNVTVNDFRPEYTLADGLHFNACRRVRVSGVFGIENGDDTLAFVTYFSKGAIGAYGGVKPPYTQPALYGWSNTDSYAENIITNGGKACGVRISGGKNIIVNNVSVEQKWYGVQVDAAKKTEENRAVGWSYLASQNITVSNVMVKNCSNGVTVRTLNMEMDEPEETWKPKAIVFNNLKVSNCKKGIEIRDTAGITVNQVWSDSPVQIINARGRIDFDKVVLEKNDFSMLGTQSGKIQKWTRSREAEPFVAAGDLSDLVSGNVTISNVDIMDGKLLLKDCAGVTVNNVKASAVELDKTKDISLNSVRTRPGTLSISGSMDIRARGIHTAEPVKIEKELKKESITITL